MWRYQRSCGSVEMATGRCHEPVTRLMDAEWSLPPVQVCGSAEANKEGLEPLTPKPNKSRNTSRQKGKEVSMKADELETGSFFNERTVLVAVEAD